MLACVFKRTPLQMLRIAPLLEIVEDLQRVRLTNMD